MRGGRICVWQVSSGSKPKDKVEDTTETKSRTKN